MSAPLETRHYIGLTSMGRMRVTFGPGDPASFYLPPHEPMPLDDGAFLYPVSAEVADAWDPVDEDATPETGQ